MYANVTRRRTCCAEIYNLNLLCRDLNHSNQYIVGLALCALGNICSAEMARDLAPEVERLMQFRDPNIRKKVRLLKDFLVCMAYF